MRKLLSIICLSLALSLYAIEPFMTVGLEVYEENGLDGESYTGAWGQIYNISEPQMQLYKPDSTMGAPTATLLVMPGGAYEYVSNDNEGIQVADYFTQRGYAVAVLHYRMPNAHQNVPLQDAQMAMLWLRQNGVQYGMNAQLIGVVGFSAGGHLAGSLLTLWDKKTPAYMDFYDDPTLPTMLRPDFGILFYPVLSMLSDTHSKTCRLLLGEKAKKPTKGYWTLYTQVREDMPPVLIIACQDDKAVPISNSLNFYQAMTCKNVPGELLIYPKGGHGWGYARTFPQREQMEASLLQWLSEIVK